ncbi:hypothetical protein AAT19DRAFT_16595 [Rhodotorula toruloides]|uniref:Uncharacterized protein n=1 Tax=Rhodotorula toruloides TaxID=5286 RepID=A0A2T0A3T3_RHOTO|nr:hypothetical protein AAT19DRAFT_16595 [Rhodotorula toruloides]
MKPRRATLDFENSGSLALLACAPASWLFRSWRIDTARLLSLFAELNWISYTQPRLLPTIGTNSMLASPKDLSPGDGIGGTVPCRPCFDDGARGMTERQEDGLPLATRRARLGQTRSSILSPSHADSQRPDHCRARSTNPRAGVRSNKGRSRCPSMPASEPLRSRLRTRRARRSTTHGCALASRQQRFRRVLARTLSLRIVVSD